MIDLNDFADRVAHGAGLTAWTDRGQAIMDAWDDGLTVDETVARLQ